MIKMITTVAIVLALASPAFAGKAKVNVTGSTGTSTYGATQTVGHVHGNAFGAAGSLTGASAQAGVVGGGLAVSTGNGKHNNAAIGGVAGGLSAGSTSVSGASSLVVGNGSAYNSSAGQSGSSATIGLKVN